MTPAEDLFTAPPGQSLAVGTFDGLHPGHLAVLKRALEESVRQGLRPAVLTFRPEPELVLTDSKPTERRLLNLDDKQTLLRNLGFRAIYEVEFTREFASWSPERFGNWLVEEGNARHVSVGYDFRYGHRRRGTTDQLSNQLQGSGSGVSVAEPVSVDDEPVSSSTIRQTLREGEPDRAAELMSRPYTVRGTIQTGDGRGGTIGFPTMNLPIEDTLHPRRGVYLVRAGPHLEEFGVANFGRRPTVDSDGDFVLEVHLLDPERVWEPGDRIRVSLTDFLRPEKEFSSVEELTEQIERDVRRANRLLEASPPPDWPNLPSWSVQGGRTEVAG